LALDAHVSATPKTGEALTLTKSAGQGSVHNTVLFSSIMYDTTSTSLYKTFEGMETFGADDSIVLAQNNDTDKNWGVTISYQTVGV